MVGVSQAIEVSISGQAALGGLPPLSVQEWLRLIRYLGQFSETFQPAKPGKISNLHQLEVASALLLQISWLLDPWPGNFHAVLQAIQRKSENQLSIRRTFGPMYRVLYTDLSEQCFQFLRDEFERYLHKNWPGVVCKRHRAFKPETIAVHPQMTLTQASKKAGVAPSTVRHFIEAELITSGQIALPSGRQTRSVHRHNAAHIAALAKDCLTLGELARLLALPEGRVRQLIASGLLKPLVSRAQNKAATWLISKRHVQELFFRGTGSSLGQTIVIVSHILKYWHLRKGEWIELVQALSNHQLVPLCEENELAPLGNVILDEKKVRLWLAEKRYASGASMSVDEAAQRLGLKQQVVYDLVKHGLLATIQDELLGRRITQANLEDFRVNYISLAEYAKSLNRAPRWLLKTLSVKPISGPMIDGSRQYFFKRIDLCNQYQQAE
ncbi:MAG: helix-turn-helix domain-containing protein [Methylobacter sp.]